MQAVFFYVAYPFIYLVACLPFPLLYLLSDFFYYILRLTGYRRKVVLKNLQNSFPEKTASEIESLANSYYRYLCDLTLETLKTLRMTEAETRARCTFIVTPFLEELHKANQSFIIVMGHLGNWEWAGPALTLNTDFQLVVIYRPLSNKYFDSMMYKTRTRFGTEISPVKSTLRDMVANRNRLTATAFIADQTATKKDAYWTTFLHQDTAVFTGPEKLAKKFNYPVVYVKVSRPKRGHYVISPEMLFRCPAETRENEITEGFTKRLEQDIKEDPTIWLWSHRRWKHKRPVT
jgi:Kdo2-lipid IVA lauroyltransferase/acyltransferase